MKAFRIMDGSAMMETYATRGEAEEALRTDDLAVNEYRHIKEYEISDREYFDLLAEKAEIEDIFRESEDGGQ
jgi:hypothetical protein